MTVRQAVKLLKDHPCSVWEQCNGYEVLCYLTGDSEDVLKGIARKKVKSITCDGNVYTIYF